MILVGVTVLKEDTYHAKHTLIDLHRPTFDIKPPCPVGHVYQLGSPINQLEDDGATP